jgi:protein-L-isoaspartate(D-aspartate) O-methyltransferase
MTEEELAVVRRAFARQMVGSLGIEDARLEAAFATVRREDFLGVEEWHIATMSGAYRKLPANDPVYVYQDRLFGLQQERGVNNGSPSLHAWMLHNLAPRAGDHVAHIGAGAGYYTALLAELVGSAGHVTAVEFDGELGARARANLEDWPNVTVVQGDGAMWPVGPADRVYVNFAVSQPAGPWIERLALDGKLIFPLGVPDPSSRPDGPRHSVRGAALMIEKRAQGIAAKSLGPAFFVCAEGGMAGDEATTLFQAFEGGGLDRVKSLRWQEAVDPARCWFSSPEWSLSFDPPEHIRERGSTDASPAGSAL